MNRPPLPYFVHPALGVVPTSGITVPLTVRSLPAGWDQLADERPEMMDEWLGRVVLSALSCGYTELEVQDQSPPRVEFPSATITDAHVPDLLRVNGTFALLHPRGAAGLVVFESWDGCTVAADVALALSGAHWDAPAI